MLSYVIKLACRLNNMSSGRKSKLWKRVAARTIHISTSLFIESSIRIIGRTKVDPSYVDSGVSKASIDGKSTKDMADSLTAYVNQNIEYWRMNRWLHPSHILRLGIGDCKNQAALLQAMFERCGVESELTVGVTNRFADEPGIHAWVCVEVGDSSLICDPVVSNKAMDNAEYEHAVRGLVDITPEYLLKEPASAIYGVGKLSYQGSLTGKAK
ncbi:MAG TPA: transglutaminase domain-containing protein [Anaerolineae bacterium]|nr:transglutaminase domain-containing protein [Anaerolineae bacterium]